MFINQTTFSISCNFPYQTRSISAENFTGEKGRGGMATDGCMAKAAASLGHGWKLSPCICIKPGETVTIADISGSGMIRHIWMTGYNIMWRLGILRFYWDDSEVPSVECPIGDFFGSAEVNKLNPYHSLMTAVNPKNGLNCYWEMPFRKKCRITFENMSIVEMTLFYQIDYLLGDVPENAGYFHAQFRRTNPVKRKEVYTIIDDIKGKGQYVGTYMYWTVHSNDWWGEGEIKFYMDGDKEYPTICGTGTEDYFCGGDGFLNQDNKQYVEYATPYVGFMKTNPDGCLFPQQRFSMYRWHLTDPVYFENDLRITIQDLGWANPERTMGYAALQDDISSVAFWYQMEPAKSMHPLLAREDLMIV